MQIGGGYIIDPIEKLQRGCCYCADGCVKRLYSYAPQRKDFINDDGTLKKSDWKKATDNYKALISFNRKNANKCRNKDKEIEVFRTIECPHKECPYHELDEVTTYREYLRTQKVKMGDISRMFSSWNKSR